MYSVNESMVTPGIHDNETRATFGWHHYNWTMTTARDWVTKETTELETHPGMCFFFSLTLLNILITDLCCVPKTPSLRIHNYTTRATGQRGGRYRYTNSLEFQCFLLTWILCSTGHSNKHGHEFLKFEFGPNRNGNDIIETCSVMTLRQAWPRIPNGNDNIETCSVIHCERISKFFLIHNYYLHYCFIYMIMIMILVERKKTEEIS